MPSENKTPNLGLNQWQGNEYAKRVDFVEDNQKIDTAFGNLEDLTTEEKSDLVAAVNEVDNTVKTHLAEKAPHDDIPFVMIRANDNQSIPHAETTKLTQLTWVTRDNLSMYENSGIRIKVPGVYLVNASVNFEPNATGIRSIRVVQNGLTARWFDVPAASGSPARVATSFVVIAEENDLLELYVYQNSGGALSTMNVIHTYMSALRVGG